MQVADVLCTVLSFPLLNPNHKHANLNYIDFRIYKSVDFCIAVADPDLELRVGEGGPGFDLLLLAFPPSVISFFFYPK